MCCFSLAVDLVADTQIFARSAGGRQFLVYGMTYAANHDLAMILPLPTPPNSQENAIEFIDLSNYPSFFNDLRAGFKYDPSTSNSNSGGAPAKPKLLVHDVGEYQASFIPRMEDFDRLDERFRISPVVWNRNPTYHDYGFAVFKLRANAPSRVHPMAFSFPQRDPAHLFFPSVHLHDGEIHPRAEFDHTLFCQHEPGVNMRMQGWWQESNRRASAHMDIDRTNGIVNPDLVCYYKSLSGILTNTDTIIGTTLAIPKLALTEGELATKKQCERAWHELDSHDEALSTNAKRLLLQHPPEAIWSLKESRLFAFFNERIVNDAKATRDLSLWLRIVEVLEAIRNPAAKAVCAQLANGPKELSITREALAALERWK